jgi:hypothetical protein
MLATREKFLQGKVVRDFLQSQMAFCVPVWGIFSDDEDDKEYNLDGSIIEVFAQLAILDEAGFRLLLKYGTGLFDPSKALVLFIGSHWHTRCKTDCLVERLLELGADANVTGYCVTPLQIAVVSWDFEVVSALLKAGADPNGTGSSDGISWEENTLMNRLNHLHSANPLHICRHFKCVYADMDERREEREEDVKRIEAILLEYGAEEILRS